MTSARSPHPVKDTAITARRLITQVTVDSDHLNRCVLGDDPEKHAAGYLTAAYRAAHGEEMASLDASSAAASEKFTLLQSDLCDANARFSAAPPELPPDRDDPRPLMRFPTRFGIGLQAAALVTIWIISISIVSSQLKEKYLRLATEPFEAYLYAGAVSLAPALAIEFFLMTWVKKGAPVVLRLASVLAAIAAIGVAAIISHMVRPEFNRPDAAAVLSELTQWNFPDAPAVSESGPPAGLEDSVPDPDAITKPEGGIASTGVGKDADPSAWFVFFSLVCEMTVAAGFLYAIITTIQAHRPLKLKPHPVRVAAEADRGRLLAAIDEVSSEAADLAGRRALHDNACILLVEEYTGRVRAARHFYDTQRTLSCL